MNYIEVVRAERAAMIPKKGFNVVVFDDFNRPGEKLTLIGNAATLDEANNVKKTLKGSIVYIYSSDGKTT